MKLRTGSRRSSAATSALCFTNRQLVAGDLVSFHGYQSTLAKFFSEICHYFFHHSPRHQEHPNLAFAAALRKAQRSRTRQVSYENRLQRDDDCILLPCPCKNVDVRRSGHSNLAYVVAKHADLAQKEKRCLLECPDPTLGASNGCAVNPRSESLWLDLRGSPRRIRALAEHPRARVRVIAK